MLLGKYKISEDSFYEIAVKYMTTKQRRKVFNFNALSKSEFEKLVKKIEKDIDGKNEHVKRSIAMGG